MATNCKNETILPAVELTSRWHEILGCRREDMSDKTRRERWETWKKMAINDGGQYIVDYWTDTTSCQNCKHIDKDWCKLMQLPCTVNPILTFGENIIGMACMGGSKEA